MDTGLGGEMPEGKTEEYKSRAFCKAVGCGVQKFRERAEGVTDADAKADALCFSDRQCRDCMAYKFHHWLQENGYTITRTVFPFPLNSDEKQN